MCALGAAEPYSHRRFGQLELHGEKLHERPRPQQRLIEVALGVHVEVQRRQVRQGVLAGILAADFSPTRHTDHIAWCGKALHAGERHLPSPGCLSYELGLYVNCRRTESPGPPPAPAVQRAVTSVCEGHSSPPMRSINAWRTIRRIVSIMRNLPSLVPGPGCGGRPSRLVRCSAPPEKRSPPIYIANVPGDSSGTL